MRALTVRGWGSVAALLVLAAVVVAAACAKPEPTRTSANAEAARMTSGFERCRSLGQAAESDAACRELWRQENQHFLGGSHR